MFLLYIPKISSSIHHEIFGTSFKKCEEKSSIAADLGAMSADPGQVKVTNASSARSDIWAKRNPRVILSTSTCVPHRMTVVETREQVSCSDVYETSRRADLLYGRAIEYLRNGNKKTSCLDSFIRFCKSWSTNGSVVANKTLEHERRTSRFSRFRATQKTLLR